MRKKMREAQLYKDPEVLKNIIVKSEEEHTEFSASLVKNVKKLAQKLEARQGWFI
jgi:predicted thioredoxin/glutaredoxin